MKRTKRVLRREEKDGEITIVTEVIEETKYIITDTYSKKTGNFSSSVYDDEGELVEGDGGVFPDSLRDFLKEKN